MAIRWASGLREAGQKAREMKWGLLVEFYSPQCEGSRAMESRTHRDGRVEGEIAREFVPFRADVGLTVDLAEKCNVLWTPTTVIFDPAGMEQHRAVGFLTSDDYIAHLNLARGKIAFSRKSYDEAMHRFKHVAENHPRDELGAEAQYWYYAAKFRRNGKLESLKEGWRTLRMKHPDSSWARKTIFLEA